MSDLLADLIGSFTDIDQDLYTLTPNNMWSILVQTHSDKSMLPHTLKIVAHIYTCMHDRTHADTHKRTTGTQTHPVFLLKQKRYSYFLLTQTCIVFLLNRYCSHITLSFIFLPLCVSHTCMHTHKNTHGVWFLSFVWYCFPRGCPSAPWSYQRWVAVVFPARTKSRRWHRMSAASCLGWNTQNIAPPPNLFLLYAASLSHPGASTHPHRPRSTGGRGHI